MAPLGRRERVHGPPDRSSSDLASFIFPAAQATDHGIEKTTDSIELELETGQVLDVAERARESQLSFELSMGAAGDVQESNEFSCGFPGRTFGDIAGNRHGRTTDLGREAEYFTSGELLRDFVHGAGELEGLLPDNEILMIASAREVHR